MKKIGKYITLVLGIVLLATGTGLLFTSKENKVKEKNTGLEKLSIDNQEVKELYSYVDHTKDSSTNGVFLLKNQKVEVDSLSDEFKVEKAIKFLEKKDFVINQDQCTLSISKNKIDSIMYKIFNNKDYNASIEYGMFVNGDVDTYSCGGGAILKYNGIDAFEGSLFEGGGYIGANDPYQTRLYEAYKDNKTEEIFLYEKVLYLNENCKEDTCDYEVYKDADLSQKIGEEKNIAISDSYDFFKNYLDKASTITYTFKKGKDSYYFFSSQVDK